MRDDRGHLRMTVPPVRKWQFLDSRTTQIFGQSLHGIGRSLKRLLDAGAWLACKRTSIRCAPFLTPRMYFSPAVTSQSMHQMRRFLPSNGDNISLLHIRAGMV